MGARTMRGPTSRYLAGSRSCHTSAGSTTWSSTEMINGRSPTRASLATDLTARQVRDEPPSRGHRHTRGVASRNMARPPWQAHIDLFNDPSWDSPGGEEEEAYE